MRQYSAVFRLRFIYTLQYRAAAAAGLATQFTWGFMEILAYAAFYRANPSAFPMTFSQTVSYIWIQQAFLALFFVWAWDNDIASSIENGFIAYELARPTELYVRWFSQLTANRLAQAALRCSPVLIVAFIIPKPYRMVLPSDMAQLLLFIVSMALALLAVVSFSMLMYITLFYTLSSVGVRTIAGTLGEFLAGGIIPLPFFPSRVRNIVELLPFAAMQNMPLRIYSGDIAGYAALRGIGLQIFWIAVLTLAGRRIMKNALKKVVVQGG